MSHRFRTLALASSLFVSMGLSSIVFAQGADSPPQPPTEPSSADLYKQHMSNGVKLFNDGNFEVGLAIDLVYGLADLLTLKFPPLTAL